LHRDNHKPVKGYATDPNRVVIEYDDGCKEIRTGGTRSWRNNNPGNINKGQLSVKFGAIGANNRFAIFPDKKTGFHAIVLLLNTPMYQTTSLLGALKNYAPSNENDTAKYVAFISKKTDIPESHAMNLLSKLQIENIAYAIEQYEGWRSGELIIEQVV
jgi:hypothetical protein